MIIVWNRYVKKALLVFVTLNIIKCRFDLSSYHFQHILVPSHMFSSGQKEIWGFKTNYSFYSHECQIFCFNPDSPTLSCGFKSYRFEE